MSKYEEMTRDEKQQVADYFSTWLGRYTHEVIKRVIPKRDEIIENPAAMMLLKELHEREQVEKKRFNDNIRWMLDDSEFIQYDPHNHCLEHSNSYRDVLYDMYIKD